MQVVAISNIKGGVGKTTTAVNLAFLAAASGRRTVLWDLDAQGAATWILRGEGTARPSAKKLVSGKLELTEVLYDTVYPGLQLLPAHLSDRNLDVHISERKHRTARLLRMSRPLRERCDFLFLDCPPGISLLTENVLHAADAVVVPMVPAPLSLRMLEQLYAFVAQENWPDLCVLPFFSMVDRRRSLHEELIAEARVRFPDILATEVPDWSEIERMTVRRAPLLAYASGSPAAEVYRSLWREVAKRLPRP